MDLIRKPRHYTTSRIEPIRVIEAWRLGFHLGNVVKYLARAEHKGAKLQDLKKARWYLDRQIRLLERETPPTQTASDAHLHLAKAHLRRDKKS